MKLRVEDIPPSGLSLEFEEDPKEVLNVVKECDFRLSGPVAAHLDITRKGVDVFITGDIQATLLLVCSRCLNDYEHKLQEDIALFYTMEKETGKERELKTEDLETGFIEGGVIDMDMVLFEELSLEAPTKPLCSNDCKGLCPVCGADLNVEVCGCEAKEKVDPRFAKLKDIKS
ncbi:MAG: DUF177 domain-containing protein [Deltaproteobacteria bacterium]|nr:DUF177 domain-containing protein [Deltaproteobacteria bacterium]